MLERIRDVFKNLTIKRHTASTEIVKHNFTDVMKHIVGSSDEDILKTKVRTLVRKSQKNLPLTLNEINFLLNYCLGKPLLETTTFKFHDSLAKHMVFALKSVYIVLDKEDNVMDLRFGMHEILLGTSITLDLSVRDLNELMLPVHFKIDPKHIH